MAAIKMQKFLGIAPKISSEHLPGGEVQAAQIANNLKLSSGDLVPYNGASFYANTSRSGTIKTIYALRDGASLVWLAWTTDVDIISASDSEDSDQRIYYTGDGVPKVTNFTLATGGSAPYPTGFYELGLPTPETVPTVAAVPFTSVSTASFQRDSANTAIITTGVAHGLRTGNIISIRDFSGTVPETFNVTNTRITVTSTTTFEYFNSGDAVSSTANTDGVVELAGNTVSRDYVFTWHTPWDEESIGSEPTETLFIKDGQQVRVTGLPTAKPSGDNNISGIRLYRTLTSPSGNEFFRLSILYFPAATVSVSLTDNVATVTMAVEHDMIVGDKFKLQGCTDSVFDIVDGEVTVIDSTFAFSYAVTNANIASKADTTGVLYRNVAELPDDDPRYWGDDSIATATRARASNVATITTSAAHGLLTGHVVTIAGLGGSGYNEPDVVITVTSTTAFTYANTGSDESSTADTAGTVTNDSFLDDFDSLNLVTLLASDDFDMPDEGMVGITVAQNNLIAGFFGNQLCFAEPNRPHAWPIIYRRTFEDDIVAIEAVGGHLLVLTEQYAYRVNGSDPLTLNVSRVDMQLPCVSKRSVVNMGYGVLYSSYGGLAIWSPESGLALITQPLHDWDTWTAELDPTEVVGKFYNAKYFGSHSTGSFLYENDKSVGGYYTNISTIFSAAWLDPLTNEFYFVVPESSKVQLWDDPNIGPLAIDWKSKTYITKDYVNFGAARVVADIDPDIAVTTAFNEGVAEDNEALWLVSEQLGTLNGPTDYVDGVAVTNKGGLNSMVLNGDNQSRNIISTVSYPVTFKLFVDKELLFTTTIADSAIFRLPTGYKSDTFEVGISGSGRLRSLHIAETPAELRKI